MATTSELQSNPEHQKTANKHSVSETGHAKNVAHFQELISFCEGYGETYNPSNERLKIPQLQITYQTAFNALNEVRIQKTNFDNFTNSRRKAFEDLKPYATKIINAFSVCGADKLTIEDAKSINKKIQGVSSKKTSTNQTGLSNEAASKSNSTSQQSYDRKIDHLANLIQMLTQCTMYNPNETELKTASVQAKLSDLQIKNLNLVTSYTQYSNAMIHRNQVLYNPTMGIVQTAKEVKLYIKSVYGVHSPQHNQVSGLDFKVRTEE
jgi:hypothetical protein